jgi:hypothetical protein
MSLPTFRQTVEVIIPERTEHVARKSALLARLAPKERLISAIRFGDSGRNGLLRKNSGDELSGFVDLTDQTVQLDKNVSYSERMQLLEPGPNS